MKIKLLLLGLIASLSVYGQRQFPDFPEETAPGANDILIIYDGTINEKVKLSNIIVEDAVNPGGINSTYWGDGLGEFLGGVARVNTDGTYTTVSGDNVTLVDNSIDSSKMALTAIYVRHLSDSVKNYFKTISTGDTLNLGNAKLFYVTDSLNFQIPTDEYFKFTAPLDGEGNVEKYMIIGNDGIDFYHLSTKVAETKIGGFKVNSLEITGMGTGLVYNNGTNLASTSVTGGSNFIKVNDGDSIVLGTGNDISIIPNAGNYTDIQLHGNPLFFDSDGDLVATFSESANVLYQSGDEKLRTTSSGVDITGDVVITGNAGVGGLIYADSLGIGGKFLSDLGRYNSDSGYIDVQGVRMTLYKDQSIIDNGGGVGLSSDTELLWNNAGTVDGTTNINVVSGSALIGANTGNCYIDFISSTGSYGWRGDLDTEIERLGDDSLQVKAGGIAGLKVSENGVWLGNEFYSNGNNINVESGDTLNLSGEIPNGIVFLDSGGKLSTTDSLTYVNDMFKFNSTFATDGLDVTFRGTYGEIFHEGPTNSSMININDEGPYFYLFGNKDVNKRKGFDIDTHGPQMASQSSASDYARFQVRSDSVFLLFDGNSNLLSILPTKMVLRGEFDVRNNKITNLANGTSNKDAVTKYQLDTTYTNLTNYHFGQMYIDSDQTITISSGATYYTVDNFTPDLSENVTTTDSTFTIPTGGNGYYRINHHESISGISNAVVHFSIFVNDVEETKIEVQRKLATATGDVGASAATGIIWLDDADVVKLKVRTETTTGTLTISHANFNIERIN